jgi:hypothetical protein
MAYKQKLRKKKDFVDTAIADFDAQMRQLDRELESYGVETGEKKTNKKPRGKRVYGLEALQSDKPVEYRILLPTQERILVGIKERGAFYPIPRDIVGKNLYNALVVFGYIKFDEFSRPYLSEKGEHYLKFWNIPYKVQPAPKFEKPSYKEEEKIIGEAEGEFRETIEPEKKREMEKTAEELIEEAKPYETEV